MRGCAEDGFSLTQSIPPTHTTQQDGRLLARLRERIWAERFEGQAYTVDHPKLRRVVQEALRLQRELLTSRYRLRDVRRTTTRGLVATAHT